MTESLVCRRSASLVFALTLVVPLAGATEASAAADVRSPAHATAKGRADRPMLARAKRSKRKPAGSGGDKAKPAPGGEADDDADDQASNSRADKPAAADSADASEDAPATPVKKRPKMESDSTAEGDGDADATVSKKGSSADAEETSAPSALTALEVGFGAKALFRQLSWTADARAAGLGPYSLTPGPQTGGWLEFYPAAFGSSGF